MGKTAHRLPRPLQIGPWLTRVGKGQRDLAEYCGVSQAYISQLISNSAKAPSVPVFLKMAAFFGLDNPRDLFERPPAGDLTGAEWAAIARMRRPQ